MILEFTNEAEGDLEQIADYIAEHNPRRALSFIRELRSRCEDLVNNPNSFALVPRYEPLGIRRREPHRVCRRLHVWMPRFMQAVFEHFRHVFGCAHVSGLSRDIRCSRWPSWRFADQAQINLTSFPLLEPRCIS